MDRGRLVFAALILACLVGATAYGGSVDVIFGSSVGVPNDKSGEIATNVYSEIYVAEGLPWMPGNNQYIDAAEPTYQGGSHPADEPAGYTESVLYMDIGGGTAYPVGTYRHLWGFQEGEFTIGGLNTDAVFYVRTGVHDLDTYGLYWDSGLTESADEAVQISANGQVLGVLTPDASSDPVWKTFSTAVAPDASGNISFGANARFTWDPSSEDLPPAAGSQSGCRVEHIELFLAGDANEDGTVSAGDLAILAASYGATSGAAWGDGDFTLDGSVGAGDLAILAANYGKDALASASAPPAVTPEPTSLALLVLGGLGLVRRRR